MPILLALALVSAPACDDEDPESGEGLQMDLTATPNPVHRDVDPAGTSTIDALLTDLDDNPAAGMTIEFETTAGTLTPPTPVATDGSGMASVTFTSGSAVTATITATSANLVGITIINVFDEKMNSHTLTPTAVTLSSCTGNVVLIGTVLDEASPAIAMSGVPITYTLTTMVDGAAAAILTTITPASPTTNGFGQYTLTVDPDDTDCDTKCTGAAVCEWIISATATTISSAKTASDVTITDGL